MITQYKEVDFNKWCKTCKWQKSSEWDENQPCYECLEINHREDSTKPEYYQKKI